MYVHMYVHVVLQTAPCSLDVAASMIAQPSA